MNEIFAKTINDPERQSSTVNDPERPPTTLPSHLCHMETKQNTLSDHQRPCKTANDWQ